MIHDIDSIEADEAYRDQIEAMEIELTPIGKIERGSDGTDQYVLLRRRDDCLTDQQAHDWLLPRVYRDGGVAGGYFCNVVRIVREDGSDYTVIAVIEHRWDI